MNGTYHETINKAHGRVEIRRCWPIADPLAFEFIRYYQGWTDLTTLVRLERQRRLPDKVERESASYISSLPNDAARLLASTRAHWVMDVIVHEHDFRIRLRNSPQNMAILRHLTPNILKAHTSKVSATNVTKLFSMIHSCFLLLLNFDAIPLEQTS